MIFQTRRAGWQAARRARGMPSTAAPRPPSAAPGNWACRHPELKKKKRRRRKREGKKEKRESGVTAATGQFIQISIARTRHLPCVCICGFVSWSFRRLGRRRAPYRDGVPSLGAVEAIGERAAAARDLVAARHDVVEGRCVLVDELVEVAQLLLAGLEGKQKTKT